MSRLPRLPPAELDGAARSLHDAIAHGRRAQGRQLFRIVGEDGALEGPFGTLLLNPGLGRRISELGEAIRYHGTLPDTVRELLILLVARERRSDYEWYAHAAVARELGLTEPALDELRRGGVPRELTAEELTAHEFYSGLHAADGVADELYQAAVARFGAAGVMEIVCLVGYYNLLASLLATFAVPLPAGVDPQFEPGRQQPDAACPAGQGGTARGPRPT